MSNSSQSEYPSLVGTVIADKYRIDRLLGAGGMGLVFLAQHVELARPVAVKLIRRELMETETIAERFLLEARAAARIQSEHVGRVLDVGRLKTGEPFIVMEYLEGLDLAEQLLLQPRFESSEAVDLLLEAVEAIAEAHQSQIVHRDLKPENLFLARQPDGTSMVKVLDFGISKQLGESSQRVLTNPSTALGSPQYMAPEQMEGMHVDVRSDIWALGAILYEMVCGRRAFDGDTLAQVCVQVLAETVPPVRDAAPDVPEGLAFVIEQCLKRDRDERFDNVAALAAALAPFGTARARISANRVAGILGMRSSWTEIRTGEAPVAVKAALPVDPLERTEVATPVDRSVSAGLPASSRTVEVNRSASRAPIFLGLSVVVLAGVGLWVFTRRVASEEIEAKAAAAAASALSTPSTLETARAAATVLEPADKRPNPAIARSVVANDSDAGAGPTSPSSTATNAVPNAAAPKAAVPNAAKAAVPKAGGLTPAAGPYVRPAGADGSEKPKPTVVSPNGPPAAAPRPGAFDRDSFGGRR